MKTRAVLIVLALVAVALPTTTQRAGAFGSHTEITEMGLGPGQTSVSFLRRAIREDIVYWNAWMDGWPRVHHDEKHFDDCEFDKAAEFIGDRYEGAREALDDLDVFRATDEFGMALHPVQDFYSHSNWVELGFPLTDDEATDLVEVARSDLVDLSGARSSLAQPWYAPSGGAVVRGDILLGGDDWEGIPDGWSIERNGAGLFVPTLVDSQGTTRGRLLETGQGLADDECDVPFVDDPFINAYTGISHNNLAKDGPSSGENYAKARALAILQTGYEWCRLVREAHLADRDGLLLAMWVRAGANPHPPGTPCQSALGSTPVTVTILSVRVLDSGDGEANDPGEIQLAAVLYDDPLNFHHSVHATNRSGWIGLDDGEFVPGSQLPAPMTVCVSPGGESTFTLHAWDNDDSSNDPFRMAFDNYGDPDELLVGFRREFGSQLPSVVQVAGSADLTVRFQVTRLPAGAILNPCPPLAS